MQNTAPHLLGSGEHESFLSATAPLPAQAFTIINFQRPNQACRDLCTQKLGLAE